MIDVHNLSIKIGSSPILTDISFRVGEGELVSLVGPSGSGKSTLLRALMGILPASDGSIALNGTPISKKNFTLDPGKRNFGIVFQSFNLFPHLNVSNNIAFGIQKLTKSARRARVDHLLELFAIADKGDRKIEELSGGEQQRVAIARAMAPSPQLMLFDEPFSNLDPGLRNKLRQELREILKREKIACVLVSHDRCDAFEFSDRIILLDNGRLIQSGTPEHLFNNPLSPFVATFLGSGNLVPKSAVQQASNATTQWIYFPHLTMSGDQSSDAIPAIVEHSIFSGKYYKNKVSIPSWNTIFENLPSKDKFNSGQKVYLSADSHTEL